MKNTITLVIGLLVIGGLWYTFSMDTHGSHILTNHASVVRYQMGDMVTDDAFLTYDFNRDADGTWFAQGMVDANNDGAFTEDEWVIQNEPAHIIKGFPQRFSMSLPESLQEVNAPEQVAVTIALTQKQITAPSTLTKDDGHALSADIQTVVITDEFGITVPGASPYVKRGVGIAHANEGGVQADGLPDLSGGPMDCFAIATANNLINMGRQHGRGDEIPTDDIPNLLESIKSAMSWENGITNANFLVGKAQIIQDLGWPVTTREIKRPSMQDVADALSLGDGVEISTTMLHSRSGKADTGHVFTGVSAQTADGRGSLTVHDPATPEGNDTLRLRMTAGDVQFIAVNYPLWDGDVIIDAIYIQSWNEEQGEEKSNTSLGGETKTEHAVNSTDTPIMEKKPEVEMTFAHVKPGEYSEIYVAITGLTPGEQVTGKLFREDSLSGAPQVGDADANGVVHFTYRITQYGHYNINVTGRELGYVGGASVDVK